MKFISKLLLGFAALGVLSIGQAFAAIDSFKVTMEPENISAGQSIDITIEAVDRNEVTVTDYNGTILLFSESDADAILPSALEQNTYTFSDSDQGIVKFENAITFSQEGLQNIYIYDLDDETVIGLGEVNVSKEEEVEELEISILSPEDGLTIGENSITISGKTQKNYKVLVMVNQDVENTITVFSNTNGDFEAEVTNLINGENTIVAHVLNADEEKVGESQEISISVDSIAPAFKSVKSNPESVEFEETFNVEVIASKDLTEVSVIINDVIYTLEEGEEGIYSKDISAPSQAGTFKIDVMLKDDLGLETKELGAGSITITAPEVIAEPEVTNEPLNAAEPEVTNQIEDEQEIDYSIKNLKVTQLKSKSVLTWDAVEGVEEYEIYRQIENAEPEIITSVNTPRFELEVTGDELKYDYFAVKAVAKTASGEIIQDVPLSEMTKVQTGPEMIILLLLSLLIGGFFFMTRKTA